MEKKAMEDKVKKEELMLETFMVVKVLAATPAKRGEEGEGEGMRQQSARYLQSKP